MNLTKFKNFIQKNKKLLIIASILVLVLCGAVGLWMFFNNGKQQANEHFTVAINADPPGTDPGNKDHTGSVNADRLFCAIHETLISFDPNGTINPKVASKWEEEDNAVIFTLRDDVLFSNGKKLTASDIKFSFERAQNKGHDEYFFQNIKILEDGKKIQLKFESTPIFLMEAISKLRILNQAAVEANEQEGLKVGAGSFKFKEWIIGDKIELELNENYYKKEAIQDSPKKMTFKIIPDPDTALLQLGEGSIDAVFDFPVDKIQNARNQEGVKVVENKTAKCSYLFMNNTKTSLEKRKLIAAVLNIPQIIEKLGLPVEQLKTFVPVTSIGHNPDIPSHFYPNQMDDVKSKIAALSQEDKKIEFGFSFKESQEVMNKIAEQLREAGFTVETHRPDFGTFITNAKKGDYHMAFFSDMHEMSYGHKAMLDYMFPGQTIGINPSHIQQDSEVTLLLNDVKGQLSKEDYVSKVKRLQQIFHDQVYVVPFYTQNAYFLTNDKVTNFTCDSLTRTDFTQIRKSN
ncbi:ABC transporter substrate-binding protein [Candidatus Phytoplasma solani]|uniref:ABC transporter substrate-binding protein n=1 Tax=Candidatus Phytoplasma solani TaxID=69896 RepID=UPI0003B7DDD0|nr:ABC transporter substrate-binding protein [Candidatus Phytoplasma solani]CCP87975.1 ABC-type dipeptide-binding protein, solute binding protein [Candidatus Phytoplasma solani]